MNKPQIIKDWERSVLLVEEMCPRSCWTCCEFNKDNSTCRKHGDIPKEFLNTIDECGDWNRFAF